ncbi:hypothetical protein DSL72_008936 [Monilinia vaccinii-corymbosi]|uniref:Histidine kinase n=1 Tax=Monilinia vaccinii-corymbosi TaxID=61207 RepID=A0A8A3PSW1_9HELO|nr:hypothetical protein DSL72_008936 [Monilinia vaccinii-corymbosi]
MNRRCRVIFVNVSAYCLSMPSLEDQPEELQIRERKRVRNLLRYYTPEKYKLTRQVEHDDLETNGRVPAALPETTCQDGHPPIKENPKENEKGGPDPLKRLTHDPTLTAFAQLGAYRLNTERSFISLMDSENQYIIAEATKSVSLHTQDLTDPDDRIFLGARILDMVWGICPNTIQMFTATTTKGNVKNNLVTADQSKYVMNDLSAIEKYKNRSYITGWPYMRFYAEVPIYSPEKHVIGTYCVVDNKPRHEGLSDEGLAILNEIATAIMKHLQLVEKQHHLERGEKMIKGLGLFVAGKSNLGEGLENSSGDRLYSQKGSNSHAIDAAPPSTVALEDMDICQLQANSAGTGSRTNGSSSLSPGFEKAAILESNRRSISRTSSPESARKVSYASTRLKQLFSRASQLILEAMNLDGVVFVDACFRDSASKIASKNKFMSAVGSTGSQDFTTNGDGSKASFSIGIESGSKRIVKPLTSDLLGCKVRHHQESFRLDDITDITLSQTTVKSLMTCYCHGRMFVCHQDGSLNTDLEPEPFEMCGNGNVEPDRAIVVGWVAELIKVCPGARTIVFFPLRDPQRDQWFAGGFAWTTRELRIMTAEDLTYLTAFGNCIMTEKSRLDSELTDRAKSDFISVVSHELRSPLHSVLSTAEALRDTSTGDEQDDMIRSIMICGEVLLDTVDHILDYAKITNKGRIKDMKDLSVQSIGPDTDFDLSNLIETIIEGVSAAQSFRQLTFEGSLSVESNAPYTAMDEGDLSDSVVIVLEIDWQPSWILNSQISSWRRILINLFQNALKYTKFGYVHVRLTAQQSVDGLMAKLSIIDSGKGISSDYLKYELFTPFVQEDPMSIGTGLGLSIVGKLVHELSGIVDIKSTVGAGTAAQVEIPVKPPTSSYEEEGNERNELIRDTRERCRGLSMCLLGFDNYPDPCEIPTDARSAKERRMTAIKSVLINYAGDWFGMIIRKACSGVSTNGVIFVCLKSQLQATDYTRTKPLIVFEDNTKRTHKEEGVFYLTQPAGPYKLARVLGQCIDYLHYTGSLSDTLKLSTMQSGVTPSKRSPFMLTLSTNGYPDSKTTEFSLKHNHDRERPDLDSRQQSNKCTDSLRPKLDLRKYSNESTDSGVDMRTCEEPVVTYSSFPFPAELPPEPKKENCVDRLDDVQEKLSGYGAEKPAALEKPLLSKPAAVSKRLTALGNSFAPLGEPVELELSTVARASPVSERLIVPDSSLVVPQKSSIVEQVEVIEKPMVIEKATVLQVVKSEPTPEPSTARTTEKSARRVVLLVEDNIINLKILVHSMKKLKEEHDTACNGLEAFEKYRKAPGTFKIIIMDISMPIMDGLTATRHIREYENTRGLSRCRIVALTCWGTDEHRRDAALSGIDLFLTKPINMKALTPVVGLDPECVAGGEMAESI